MVRGFSGSTELAPRISIIIAYCYFQILMLVVQERHHRRGHIAEYYAGLPGEQGNETTTLRIHL